MKLTARTINTKRLVLKDFNENDQEALYAIFGDEHTMKYYDIEPFPEMEKVQEIINLKNKRLQEGTGIRWGIFLDNQLIGTCGFNSYQPKGRSTIGYDINKKYWNRGYATEAIEAMSNYGFSELEIHRIEAYVTPGNIASEKVLKKCGFEKEGVLKQAFFFKGKYQDQILYAKINFAQPVV